MAKVMHQFMVKSSVGTFRARFVVPLYDWPQILESDDNVYDSVSATIDDNAARTRFGSGVLVTDLGSPQTTDRMCSLEHTVDSQMVHHTFYAFWAPSYPLKISLDPVLHSPN